MLLPQTSTGISHWRQGPEHIPAVGGLAPVAQGAAGCPLPSFGG